MDTLWFYADEGQHRGPVPFEQLVTALLAAPEPRRVLVWREGLADWQEAGAVPEISGRLPPPRPSAPPYPSHQAGRLGSLEDAETMARLYRRLVLLVGAQILLSLAQLPMSLAPSRGVGLLSLLVVPVSLGLLVAIAITAYNLSRHLGESVPVLWAIVMFLPCFNLIGLLVLSAKAQAWCSRYGLKVGLLGPTKESIEELRQRMMTSPFE